MIKMMFEQFTSDYLCLWVWWSHSESDTSLSESSTSHNVQNHNGNGHSFPTLSDLTQYPPAPFIGMWCTIIINVLSFICVSVGITTNESLLQWRCFMCTIWYPDPIERHPCWASAYAHSPKDTEALGKWCARGVQGMHSEIGDFFSTIAFNCATNW